MMYKSQIQNIDPHDLFCGPGSRLLTFYIQYIYLI